MLVFVVGCGPTATTISENTIPYISSDDVVKFFDVKEIATDATYGYTIDNPIKVGGFQEQKGTSNERQYLASLAGPKGQTTRFRRLRSCCAFNTENGVSGIGLLDVYEVVYPGLREPILLYINFYDYDKLFVPQGFTPKK